MQETMDSRFRRGLGLCFTGIAMLLVTLVVASSSQPAVELVGFAILGLLIVFVGAVLLAG